MIINKKGLIKLVDEFENLNTNSDSIESAGILCLVILHLSKIGHDALAELLVENKYNEAREYIGELEC